MQSALPRLPGGFTGPPQVAVRTWPPLTGGPNPCYNTRAMSLRKKIILGFSISALIIDILIAFVYVNFMEIKKEIRYLELTDSLRSKSLQLRRHEKNFFLYGEAEELAAVHTYLDDIMKVAREGKVFRENSELHLLVTKAREYDVRFMVIEEYFTDLRGRLAALKSRYLRHSDSFALIEALMLERPLVGADFISKVLPPETAAPFADKFRRLGGEIRDLRKTGEELLVASKDLDISAKRNVEHAIRLSQTAALILFPLFFFVGIGTLLAISHNVVKRLKSLMEAVSRAGRGEFAAVPVLGEKDEVSMLIISLNQMEKDLMDRDWELIRKNEELLHSRKLASIGTLASGVAHELNNPINNIYLAAQTLARQMEKERPSAVTRESVKDICSQTLRVKRIVGDLLEFSREKPPELKTVDIVEVVREVHSRMSSSGEMASVQWNLAAPESLKLPLDRQMMEQVFINLFGNAVDAMEGTGRLDVEIARTVSSVTVRVADSGKGISPEDVPRVFDPFFTTKEKGTGLGLAIVHNIIAKHKGKVELESRLDNGTTFTIILQGAP